MDDGGVGMEGGEGVACGEEEEAEGKVGIVADSEEDLGCLWWSEPVREQGEEGGPPGFGAVMG